MTPKEWTVDTVFKKLSKRWPESFYDLYPGYSKPKDSGFECFFQTKKAALAIALEIIEKFQALPNRIPVFRTLSLRNEEALDLSNLGESWSLKRSSAEAFAKRELPKNIPILLLVGEIDSQDVDWNESLSKHLIYSMAGETEDELYILNDHLVTVIDKIWIKK